jgi:hypothetical protein
VTVDTGFVVPTNVADDLPATTLIVPGMTKAGFELVRLSVVPLAGATPESVTTNDTVLPPSTADGVATTDKTRGVFIETFATTAMPFALAVTFEVTSDATTVVDIGTVTDAFPAGTVIDAGNTNDEILDVSFTISAPAGAGTVRSIVSVPFPPPVSSDGENVIRCGAGTRMAKTVDADSAFAVALIVA